MPWIVEVLSSESWIVEVSTQNPKSAIGPPVDYCDNHR
jgi:hypothetical protein